MSLAVPSSYSEYIFDQTTRHFTPPMLCNGQIMPFRQASESAGTNWTRCLRGEDVFFLSEGIYSRGSLNDLNIYFTKLGLGMTNEIDAARLQDLRDVIWNQRNMWQNGTLTVAAHDFGTTEPDPDQHDVQNWFYTQISGLGRPLEFISFSRGNQLSMSKIYSIFQVIRQMNYTVDGNQLLNTAWDTGHTANISYLQGGTWHTDSETRTDLWISDREENYTGSTSKIYDFTEQSGASSINIDLSLTNTDNFPRVCDLLPMGLIKVENSWSWYNTTYGNSDSGTEQHWVIVPLSDNYLSNNGSGEHYTGLRSADDVIDEAFQTAGLVRDADDIVAGTSPSHIGTWGWHKQAEAQIVSIFNLVHFNYCTAVNN